MDNSLLYKKVAEHKRLRKVLLSQRDILAASPEPKGNFRENYTLAELDAVYDRAKGQCEICGEGGKLHLDHCHNTGRIRGLLCMRCNTAIGRMYDDPDLLKKAIAYLER